MKEPLKKDCLMEKDFSNIYNKKLLRDTLKMENQKTENTYSKMETFTMGKWKTISPME